MENYTQKHKKTSDAISQYEYDTNIKTPAHTKVHDRLNSMVHMVENLDKIPQDKQAAMMMLMEKLVPGSVCTKEKIRVTVEKEHIPIKEFIESMFPDVEYSEVKKTFEKLYQDYKLSNNN